MPILVHLVVAWLAGLAFAALAFDRLGFGGEARIACLLLATALVTRLSRHRSRMPALLLISGAALLFGAAAARSNATCISALAAQPSLHVAVDDRAAPARTVPGEARGVSGALASCRVRATVRVKDGSAAPGSIVTVAAPFQRTQRGVRVESAIAPTGRTDWLRAWRGSTGERIDSLFGRNAALVRALLIADQDGIPPDVRDRFADAGLVHMLSISGLHVAIIASALLVLASASGIPRGAATICALCVVALYVIVLGAPAPAVRSAVMLATVSASERWQRPVHPWTALALGAAIPTFQPAIVLDLGYQLSVGGMAALVAARALLRRVRNTTPSMGNAGGRTPRSAYSKCLRAAHRRVNGLRGWQWTLAREAATGVIATLVTAPLIAWTFGRVSIVAPLSNIAAGPIVAFVQPALFLALLLSPWHAAARFVADATGPPLALLDGIARVSAAVPYAALHVAPTLLGACCAGVASAAFVRATASRRLAPGILCATGALVVGLWSPLLVRGNGEAEFHMLDVGQGDALAVRTPRGRWLVVDAGRRWDGGDAGRRVVVPYIQRRGGRVAAFVMSHPHDDHAGGAASVVRALAPQRWWEAAFVTASPGYRESLRAVREQSVEWHRVRPGDSLAIDGVHVEVLAPDSSWTMAQHDANETSVVLRVRFGSIALLLTGDAEAEEEAWLVQHTAPEKLRAHVLKVGHHGSRTSSTTAFLDAVRPDVALVSVGEGNRYGHPAPETLSALAARGVSVLRTDRDGAVVVRTDGTRLTVVTRGDRWTIRPRRDIHSM